MVGTDRSDVKKRVKVLARTPLVIFAQEMRGCNGFVLQYPFYSRRPVYP